MRARVCLWLSIALNVALASELWRHYQSAATARSALLQRTILAAPATSLVKTNFVVRRQYFSWAEIESPDYPTYLANLRDIGCPASTIRDLIVADVNQLYAQKRLTEVPSPEQQWWRATPDPAILLAAAEKLRALDTERRALLTRLLGPGWESPAQAASTDASPVAFTGPILGGLTSEQKQIVQVVSNRSLERQQAYLAAQQAAGKEPDPAELARLRQQTRDELAAALTPEQLQEFLLRYSQTATLLRQELRGFDGTPEEFRALFRLRDPLEQQIQAYGNSDDPESLKRRQELEQQRDALLDQALGPERAQLVRLQKEPAFLQTRTILEQIGATPESVLPVYQVNHASQLELERLAQDASLSAEQREAALRDVKADQQRSLQKLLGAAAFQRYQTNRGQ